MAAYASCAPAPHHSPPPEPSLDTNNAMHTFLIFSLILLLKFKKVMEIGNKVDQVGIETKKCCISERICYYNILPTNDVLYRTSMIISKVIDTFAYYAMQR